MNFGIDNSKIFPLQSVDFAGGAGRGLPAVSPDQESGPIVVWMAEIASTAIGKQT